MGGLVRSICFKYISSMLDIGGDRIEGRFAEVGIQSIGT